MRIARITTALLAAVAGIAILTGCDSILVGSPVIDHEAAVVVYQQQAGERLVTTMNKYFDYNNGKSMKLVNNSISIDFKPVDVPDSATCGNLFSDLGFDSTANALMDHTTGNSGVQTAESEYYTATWTYSSLIGLSLTLTVRDAV
jgi:hypothetical protein